MVAATRTEGRTGRRIARWALLGLVGAAGVLWAPAVASAQATADGALDEADTRAAESAEPDPARENPSGIEEIRVTARRREELLQQTPLSITAFSEFELEARSVESIDDISASVPNLEFDATAGTSANARIFIRGVGQDDPIVTADPGVGLYVDGVSYTRATGSIFDTLDVERVEVLRGPQGALYGKSTIGGAINVITRKPAQDFSGRVTAGVGHDDRRDFSARASVPLIENKLFSKFAVSTRNRDGFARDTLNDRDLQNARLTSARTTFLWLPTENIEATLRFDRTYRREESVAFKLRGIDFENGFVGASELTGTQFGSGLQGGPFSLSNDTPSRSDVDTYGFSLNVDWDVSDAITLQSITARREIESKINTDVDGSGDGGIGLFVSDETRQFSQEFRLLGSALKSRLDYGVGAFYFREDGQSSSSSKLFDNAFQFITGIRNSTPGAVALSMEFRDPNTSPERQEEIQAQLASTFAPFGETAEALAVAVAAVPDDNIVDTRNRILNTNYAAYAYASFQLTDKIEIELAGRYNYEIKDLFRNQLLVPSGSVAIDNASVDATFRDFSPSFNIAYQANDDLLTFFRVARGFKSGGFNGRAQRIRAGGVGSEEAEGLLKEYDPETITSFELGVKSTWLDGRLVANSSLFYNLYDDIQQQRLGRDETGQLTSIIDNAAQAIIQGLELELVYRPDFIDDLTIQTSGSLTYGRFTSFPGGKPNPNFDEDDPASGPPAFSGTDLHLSNTPLFTGNLMVTKGWDTPIGALTTSVDYSHRTRSFNNVRNSRFTRSPKRGVLGTRVSLTPNFLPGDGDTRISIVGRNILDREYIVNGLDLLDAFGFASAQYLPPRSFSIQLTHDFY